MKINHSLAVLVAIPLSLSSSLKKPLFIQASTEKEPVAFTNLGVASIDAIERGVFETELKPRGRGRCKACARPALSDDELALEHVSARVFAIHRLVGA